MRLCCVCLGVRPLRMDVGLLLSFVSWQQTLAFSHAYPISRSVRLKDGDTALETEEPEHVSAFLRLVSSLRMLDQRNQIGRYLPELFVKRPDLGNAGFMPDEPYNFSVQFHLDAHGGSSKQGRIGYLR